MKKLASEYKRIEFNKITLAIVTLIMAAWLVHPCVAAEAVTDAQKRQTIEKMVADFRDNFPDVVEMDSLKAMELVQDQKVIFIDVRRTNEQEISMLPGAITYITYLKNQDKYNDYLKISYCTIGYRSARFAQMMHQNGTAVYNLHGGMLGWLHDGGKVYDKNGQSFRIHVYGRPWKLAPEGYQEVW